MADPFPATKFFVVDGGGDDTFRYSAKRHAGQQRTAVPWEHRPRGVAIGTDSKWLWVVDKDKFVYKYDAKTNALITSWKAKKPDGSDISDKVQGIATDGANIWLVDDDKNLVLYYVGGASFTSATADTKATSTFPLGGSYDHPRGIAWGLLNGTPYLWVVDDDAADKVLRYTANGTPAGSWTIGSANAKPTGITVDSMAASDIWIVDDGVDRIFTYTDAAARSSGSQVATNYSSLSPCNTQPRGIADPDPKRKIDLTTLFPTLPTLSINDVTVDEREGLAIFTVSLSEVSNRAVSVRYATSNGTASSRGDYTAKSGTLTIPAGQSSGTITVKMKDDLKPENDESFYVKLSKPKNGTLDLKQAQGTIRNDDFALQLAAASGQKTTAGALTADQLAAVTDEAIRRWTLAAGEEAKAGLSNVVWELADLSGDTLSVTSGRTVRIDRNAAGWGWFVDGSPWDDDEFLQSVAAGELQARPGGPADRRADLLTAVMHELGHVLDLSYGLGRGAVASDVLALGQRRLP